MLDEVKYALCRVQKAYSFERKSVEGWMNLHIISVAVLHFNSVNLFKWLAGVVKVDLERSEAVF